MTGKHTIIFNDIDDWSAVWYASRNTLHPYFIYNKKGKYVAFLSARAGDLGLCRRDGTLRFTGSNFNTNTKKGLKQAVRYAYLLLQKPLKSKDKK